jgi:hypothetical protein
MTAAPGGGTSASPPTTELAKQTWVSLEVADFLNKREWLVRSVEVPEKSDGLYDEGCACSKPKMLRKPSDCCAAALASSA